MPAPKKTVSPADQPATRMVTRSQTRKQQEQQQQQPAATSSSAPKAASRSRPSSSKAAAAVAPKAPSKPKTSAAKPKKTPTSKKPAVLPSPAAEPDAGDATVDEPQPSTSAAAPVESMADGPGDVSRTTKPQQQQEQQGVDGSNDRISPSRKRRSNDDSGNELGKNVKKSRSSSTVSASPATSDIETIDSLSLAESDSDVSVQMDVTERQNAPLRAFIAVEQRNRGKAAASKSSQQQQQHQHRFNVVSYNLESTASNTQGVCSGSGLAAASLPASVTEGWTGDDPRHAVLLAELSALDADVVCLHGVDEDYYCYTLKDALASFGFGADFKSRLDCTVGEATFYRLAKFELVLKNLKSIYVLTKQLLLSGTDMKRESVEAMSRAMVSRDVALFTKLRHVTSGRCVTIGNTSLANVPKDRIDVQCLELCTTLKSLVMTSMLYFADAADDGQRRLIFCCNLDAPSSSPLYQLTTDCYLSDETIEQLQQIKVVKKEILNEGSDKSMIDLWWQGFQHTQYNLRSAYSVAQRGVEPLTNANDSGRRSEGEYIWFSDDTVDLAGVFEVPSNSADPPVDQDCAPSPHISAVATFKL